MSKSLRTPRYNEFRSILIDARVKKGVTQAELGNKLNKPQSYISKYESGERRLDVIEFIDIANALGVNPTDVIKLLLCFNEVAKIEGDIPCSTQEEFMPKDVRQFTVLQLEQSSFFLQQTEMIAHIGGWRANPDKNTLFWTDGVFEILECEKTHQPTFLEGGEFFREQYRSAITLAMRETMRSNTPFNIVSEVKTCSGKIKWVEMRGLRQIEGGNGPELVGTLQDITARKEIEDTLRQSEERFKKLYNALNSVMDMFGREVNAEKHAVAIRTQKEVKNELSHILISDALRQTFGNVKKASVLLSTPRSSLMRFIKKHNINVHDYKKASK